MRLFPILLNLEHQDPVLLVPIPQKSQILLFDLGYCFRLKVRDIKKITKIFISHTHIDHFIGFDHILRLSLDMEKTISIYGPAGIIKNVQGKLNGYTWNLADGVYLNFSVYEITKDKILNKKFEGNKGFFNSNPPKEIEFHDNLICNTEDYKVEAKILQHKMDVLGFRLTARPSYNASIKDIKEMGLEPGKWLKEIKTKISKDKVDWESSFNVDGKIFKLKDLSDKIINKTPGTIITYIVDTIYNDETQKALKKLAHEADILFCESAYLSSQNNLAQQNYHLTASQAAQIAKMSNVKKLIPFHFSRRYEGEYDKIFKEAMMVFQNVEKAQNYRL